MQTQSLAILGSTGSIGVQALEIVEAHPELFSVEAVTANRNWERLADQITTHQPNYAVICTEDYGDRLTEAARNAGTELLVGTKHLEYLAADSGSDTVLNSLVGFSGFKPTVEALKAGKKVALANKESLVVGGALITNLLEEGNGELVPVDSEHSAMLQSIVGEPEGSIAKIIVTASGGPFRTWSREEMEEITVTDALNHPNWSMGSKITVDSATMMNKGLEIIEAFWLFDLPLEQIQAVIHPQSVVHSIVEFVDGSSKAQLGPPTMKVPIQYALTYPGREPLEVETLDWTKAFDLNFEPMDLQKFPCLRLAREAIAEGGVAPAILNAANEIAVARFLNEEIRYLEIAEIVEAALSEVTMDWEGDLSVDLLTKADAEARRFAHAWQPVTAN